MNSFSIRTLILLAMLLPQVSWAVAEALLAEPALVPTEAGSASSSSDAERAESISRADLAALAEQFNAQIDALRKEFATSLKSQQATIAEQERLLATQTTEIETQKGVLAALNAQLSQLETTR